MHKSISIGDKASPPGAFSTNLYASLSKSISVVSSEMARPLMLLLVALLFFPVESFFPDTEREREREREKERERERDST